MQISEFQNLIERMYFERDVARGPGGTFMWFVEEVGELATALRTKDAADLAEEFADVFAWLCTLASISGIRMEEAVAKYVDGCPGCDSIPCTCDEEEKG